MPDSTTASQIALLTPLPSPPSPAPQLASGTVSLFVDDNWDGDRLDISISEFAPGQRQTMQTHRDEATWLAFNLPVGVVMTLMDNIVNNGRPVADLTDCGQCIDLVGNGQTQGVDLGALGQNDNLSAFFWRTVDLDMGAIELFSDFEFGGNRSTIFLSEWIPGAINTIDAWWLQDAISSIRWRTLNDRQTAVLFDESDGSGNQYNNIKGWGSVKEIANLDDFGIADSISAFRWNAINPMKEIIAPFIVTPNNVAGNFGVTASHEQNNDTPVRQSFTLSIDKEDAQEVTTSTTDTHVAGITATWTSSVEAGVEAVGKTKTEWSVAVKYEYTHSATTTTSQRQTVALHLTWPVEVAPFTQVKASLLVNIGQLPATTYHTTAERWYDQPVTGGIQDAANNGWYKRIEPVSINVAGSVAINSTATAKATNIPHGHKKPPVAKFKETPTVSVTSDEV